MPTMAVPTWRWAAPQVQIQPHSVDFYEAVRSSGQEVQAMLTASLSRFSCLTEDGASSAAPRGCWEKLQLCHLGAEVNPMDSEC